MMLRTMKRLLPPLTLATGLLLIAPALTTLNCGSDKEKQTGSVELDACALLAEINPAEILGEPVEAAHSILQQHDADSAVSMCGVSAKGSGLKSVSLLVKYYRNSENPKTAEAFVGTKQLDYGGEKLTPKEISGLGDMAVSLQGSGVFQLWVFWKKHYRMSISLTEFDDQALASEKARLIARHVMDKL